MVRPELPLMAPLARNQYSQFSDQGHMAFTADELGNLIVGCWQGVPSIQGTLVNLMAEHQSYLEIL